MAEKNRGISPELLIHPGETISDLLEERGISQKELARRTGVSEPFLSDVIHGKKDISRGLAKGLEYATGVSASFWLKLQANYDAELLEYKETESISEEERKAFTVLHDVISYLKARSLIPEGLKKDQTILHSRKVLHISNLDNLRGIVSEGALRISEKQKINPHVFGAWFSLCKIKESEIGVRKQYDPNETDQLISELKKIMLEHDEDPKNELQELFADYGIEFDIMKNFRGAPVQGYISKKSEGIYKMILTIRGAYADIFWFSLFHELGHIVNGDVNGSYIDSEDLNHDEREEKADRFAADVLLNGESYDRFVERCDYTIQAIKRYAESENVPVYIVIGRLQKEKIIPYSYFNDYKLKYQWIEA